jgi:Putative transposase, YhgA-like
MATSIHDALFKATFSQVEHAAGELQAILPPALSARIDFATLTLCPGNFVDPDLRQRYTDLLFSAEIADMWEVNETIGAEELRRLVAREVGKDVEEAIVTTADMLRAEGRSEGLSKGQRAMLLKLLSKRFGALPEDAVARVNAAGSVELEAWFDRGLSATSLADVLGKG